MSADTDPSRTDWERILDRFDTALAADHQAEERTWAEPLEVGPLPAELLERATATLTAQHALMELLEQGKDVAARHLAAVRVVEAGASAHPSIRPSVYVDVSG